MKIRPMTQMQWAIAGLAIATAAIHIWLGVSFVDVLFILNGLGFLGLLGVLYLDMPQFTPYRAQAHWVLIGYTTLTIVLYFLLNGDLTSPVGLVTKVIEIALIILLLREM